MSASRTHYSVFAAAAMTALLLGGCSADSSGSSPADTTTQSVATADAAATAGTDGAAPDSATEAAAAPAADAPGERPEGLDGSLPVPPGNLATATQKSSSWEYIYTEVTSDEARVFADTLKAMGFKVKVTVDSDGVEQWHMQSDDWSIKLEETHAEESLRYAIDPITQ